MAGGVYEGRVPKDVDPCGGTPTSDCSNTSKELQIKKFVRIAFSQGAGSCRNLLET